MPVVDPRQAVDLSAIRSTAQMVAGFKTTAGAYQPRPGFMIPVLGITFIMANGEERKPVNLSPELVLPLVATLTNWAAAIQDAMNLSATGLVPEGGIVSEGGGPMPEDHPAWPGQGRGEPSEPAQDISERPDGTVLSTEDHHESE